MIVDTSALLAVVFDETDRPTLNDQLLQAVNLKISAANWLEGAIRVDGSGNPADRDLYDKLLDIYEIEIVPVSVEQAHIAREAYREFGKGRHPAKLNYGDCFAYALAKVTGLPLLFKGNDFSQTDIVAVT